MTRVLDRQKAHDLRQQGKSYSQIKSTLGISKSTLSGWLRDYPLTKGQIDLLRGKNPKRIERFRETMRLKKEERLKGIYLEEKGILLPLTLKELLIAGLFLYWGEGNKSLKSSISVNNTDPSVIKFALYWMVVGLKVPKSKIKVSVHLYSDMDINQELKYWSGLLGLPLSQFRKPYIKQSTREGINQKGGYGHGTCGLVVSDTRLKEKIMMGILSIADHHNDII